ncbi:Zinc finger MYM-type protein 1-like [Oopsacas minuta]|uniref:Zinc finger MYM-type protein 1-like n=1 Tax=Oopsacas minuta TaxID=111878 RepID=A0AAV7JBX8_9METZ|nr:Zinc finger MYM-type protein 1-like [Oopsacas minuta]KAI6646226.1 Zinc finger MYM-type protein 1-like [Oopsacas minuta]
MTKRLQQSKVQAYFKRNRIEIEDHVVSSNYEEVEPVVTSIQVSTPLTSDSCTTISTPSLNTTHIQSPIVTVNDLSNNGEKPRQPSIIFPKNEAGRHFSTHWYAQFSWIEYSKELDAIFCQPCRLFGGSTAEATFSTKGLCDWRKLGDKCRKHDSSVCHMAAVETQKVWPIHQIIGTVDKQLDPNFRNEKFIDDNRKHLMTVLDIITFCVKQDIPLRGDDESDQSLNKGNFLEILELLGKYDSNVTKRIESLPGNAKMLSPDIQNDLLTSLASVLLDYVKSEVEIASCYAILADEVKDASKKELLGASLRYIHKGNVRERAIGFIELKDMDAGTISEKLIELLKPFELDPLKCVGQGYDGASVMSGIHGGVQARMKGAGYRNATYVHCASHRLNLVLAATAERHPLMKSFFDILDLTYSFMNGTKRHAVFIDVQDERYPPTSKLLNLHVHVVLVGLPVLWRWKDTSLAAKSLLGSLQTKKFMTILVYFGRLYDYSDFCTKAFQKSTATVSSCLILLADLRERLVNFDFDKVVEYAKDLSGEYEIENFDVRDTIRQRRLPERFREGYLNSSVGHTNASNFEELEILLRQNVREILAGLDARFGTDQSGIMKAADCCLPRSQNFLNKQELNTLSELYAIDIKDCEIEVLRSFIARKMNLS